LKKVEPALFDAVNTRCGVCRAGEKYRKAFNHAALGVSVLPAPISAKVKC